MLKGLATLGSAPGISGLLDQNGETVDRRHRQCLAQGHEEGDELVGAGLDGDAAEGSEGAGAAPESESDRVSEKPGRSVVAEVGRFGEGEGCGSDLLDRGVDAGGLGVRAAERAQNQEVRLGLGQDDPFPAARASGDNRHAAAAL